MRGHILVSLTSLAMAVGGVSCAKQQSSSNAHLLPSYSASALKLSSDSHEPCRMCHTGMDEKPNVHGALKMENTCDNCHDSHASPEPKYLKNQAPGLCIDCHGDLSEGASVVHGPVKDARACLNCHDPHSADFPKLLVKNSNDLCISCHNKAISVPGAPGVPAKTIPNIAEKLGSAMTSVHPAALDSCKECHVPHAGAENLVAEKPQQLCIRCHSDIGDEMAAGNTKTHAVHGALFETGSCANCHDPHGSVEAKLLKSTAPDVCTQCHSDIPEPAPGEIVHGAILQKGGCTTCHKPHSADNPNLVVPNLVGACLSCHSAPINVPATSTSPARTLPNIKERLEMKSVHGPAQGGCENCHVPHTGRARLLMAEFSPKMQPVYSDPNAGVKNPFGLCFQCHDSAILKETITGAETNFRLDVQQSNGTVTRKNLHWRHVLTVSSTGKVTARSCRYCHDFHGAPQDHLLGPTALGTSQFGFTGATDGGTCTMACHAQRSYSRIAPKSR